MLTIVVVVLLTVPTGAAHALRPLDTLDTGTVEPGRVELELGTAYTRAPDQTEAAVTGVLTVGVIPSLEVRIESAGLFIDPDDGKSQSGLGDSLVGAKYRLVDEAPGTPAVLIGLGVRLPTGDESAGLGMAGVSVGVVAAVSKTFGPVTVTGNGGYVFATADRGLDAGLLAGSVEYRVAPDWLLVSEVVAELGASRRPTTAVVRAGVVWAANERFRLDAAIGTGLTRDSPDLLVTLGITIFVR